MEYCIAAVGQLNYCLSHPVTPSILSSSTPVSEVLNSSASLFCSVRGYPLPTISWLKDGVPVATDSSITITTQSATVVSPGYLQQLNATFTGDVGVISVVQFGSLQRKDNGMYVCQAINSLSTTGTYNTSSAISITVLGMSFDSLQIINYGTSK